MNFVVEVLTKIMQGSGFAALDWRTVVMLLIACVLLYMGIVKGYEPLLMVPIAFGMLLANLPVTGLFNEPVYDAATAAPLVSCGCSIRASNTPSIRPLSLWASAR